MALSLADVSVLVRGGGEMASGIAHRLHQCHMKVLITEVEKPTAVRRTVAFAEAVYEGSQTIEGVKAVKVASLEEAKRVFDHGHMALMIDPEANVRTILRPIVVVDAIMAKRNSHSKISDAPLVVGVGPGFVAGVNVHAVVESNRGYNLGRVLWSGEAERDTGVPALVGGYTEARVLRAPRDGRFKALREIGEVVQVGAKVAEIDGEPIRAQIQGVVRGMLKDGIEIQQGAKAGDIDPRGERGYCYLISDKARAIAGGVLEAICHSLNHPESA